MVEEITMKIRWNHRYVQLGVTAFLVIAASILFYYGIFHMKSLVTGIKSYYDFGYYDQNHFIKEFKLFYGKTPSKIAAE